MRMTECCAKKLSHKEWRRVAKKDRRSRLRRKAAQERDAEEERQRAALESSAGYLNCLNEQEKLEKEREEREKQEHEEWERRWLEEEVRAQKEWQIVQQQREKEKQEQLELRMKIHEKFEAKQEVIRKKEEEKKRKHEEQLRKQEQLYKEIDNYIDNGTKTPEILREVIDTQPSKDLCPFFLKTGACRYGDTCSKNHRIVCLSKVILVPGFYSHFSLEKNSAEYDTDVTLEYEASETWHHFREFYEDVISELKSYGRIKILRCCCNTEAHLRGNLYIEYYTEREAARAWRKLNGRWYAGKQLKCEFANVTSWRSAICGMSKCPKGTACNFLHTFRNPRDEYSVKKDTRWAKVITPQKVANNSKRSEQRSKWEESVRDNGEEERDWRWSESPEVELDHRSKSSERKRSRSREKEYSRRSSRDRKYEKSERSGSRSHRSSRNSRSPEKHRRSSRKRSHDEENQVVSNGRSSRRLKKDSGRRDDHENGHEESRRKH